jgi:hypothetical protein
MLPIRITLAGCSTRSVTDLAPHHRPSPALCPFAWGALDRHRLRRDDVDPPVIGRTGDSGHFGFFVAGCRVSSHGCRS